MIETCSLLCSIFLRSQRKHGEDLLDAFCLKIATNNQMFEAVIPGMDVNAGQISIVFME